MRLVEGVEEFDAELHPKPLSKISILEEREIGAEESGPSELIAPGVSDGDGMTVQSSHRLRWRDETQPIEKPILHRPGLRVLAYLIRTASPDASIGQNPEGLTSCRGKDEVHLPSTDQPSPNAAGASPHPPILDD